MVLSNSDSLSWLASSAFQGLTSYVSVIFMGLVFYMDQQTVKNGADGKEESEKKNNALKLRFLVLLILISITLVLSAVALFFNAIFDGHWRFYFSKAILICVVICLGGGIWFILYATNPKRDIEAKNEVKKEIEEKVVDPQKIAKNKGIKTQLFIMEMIEIEKLLRNLNGPQDPSKRFVSLNEQLKFALEKGRLDVGVAGKLSQLVKYRNIVVHGVEPTVPEWALVEAKKMHKIIAKKTGRNRDSVN